MTKLPAIASLKDIEAVEAHPYDAVVPFGNIYEIFQRGAERYGDAIALTALADGDPETPARRLSYNDMLAGVTRAANLFRAHGVGESDAVAILAPNLPETHFALWGAEVAGRACPINFMLNEDHIVELLQASGTKVVVALGPDAELPIWDKAVAVAAQAGVGTVFAIGGAVAGQDFADALAGQPDTLAIDRKIGRDDIAAYFHTGGTTGAPKLAQHTHGNQVHTSWAGGLHYDLREGEVMVCGFPLFHVAGSFVYGLSVFAAGAELLLAPKLGMRDQNFIANFWKFCEKYKTNMLAAVPTTIAMVLAVDAAGADLSRVRVMLTGGTPLPSELAAAFEAKMAIPVRNILGMTECAGLVTIAPLHGPRIPGSTGLRLPFTEVKAAPRRADGSVDTDASCGPDETGVIVLRGPNVGPGYTDKARNAGVFTEDGWLISGDLGHVDADGNVFVTGRSKDVIIRGAHNIDPAMIEETTDQHPAVEMSAAVGQPDAHAGELPVVYVTLKPGKTASEQELLAFLEPRIAERPAMPKRAFVVDAMPLTAIGKIYKPGLRLDAMVRVFGELLAGAADEIAVEGVDDGGKLSARLLVKASDPAAAEREIAARLRDFAIDYTIDWD